MLNAMVGPGKGNTLMGEYATLLTDSVLRHRAWVAEHTARLETQLANKVKSEFIANMSHELRTPLNTVIGFAKLIGEHETRALSDGDISEYAGLIHDAATHLLAVINDVLDISKLQSGRYTLDHGEVDLAEVLKSVLEAHKVGAAEVGIDLVSHVEPDLPLARGDVAKLRQVFSNLIGNAVRFTQPGGKVTVEACARPGGCAAVYVRDTGVGMSDEEVAVALTPFGQVDAGHSRWREGAGLGLPIAKALVQLHGGSIEISSARGQGTQVAVLLPSPSEVSAASGAVPLLNNASAG